MFRSFALHRMLALALTALSTFAEARVELRPQACELFTYPTPHVNQPVRLFMRRDWWPAQITGVLLHGRLVTVENARIRKSILLDSADLDTRDPHLHADLLEHPSVRYPHIYVGNLVHFVFNNKLVSGVVTRIDNLHGIVEVVNLSSESRVFYQLSYADVERYVPGRPQLQQPRPRPNWFAGEW